MRNTEGKESAKKRVVEHFNAGRLAKSLKLARSVYRLSSDDADIPQLIAMIYYRQAKFAEALVWAKKATRLEPARVDSLNLLSSILVASGDVLQAVEYCRRALELEPGNPALLFNLGNLYKSSFRFDEACKCFRKSLELKPDYLEARNNYINALLGAGRPKEACAEGEAALEVCGPHPVLHLAFANALLENERLEEAENQFRLALRLNADFPEALCGLGELLRRRGEFRESLTCCSRATALSPQMVGAWVNLGNVQKDLGNFAAALASFQRVVDLQPSHVEACINSGFVCLQLGDTGRSIRYSKKALEHEPENILALNNLANAYTVSGRLEEGVACYERAHALEPDNPVVFSNMLLALNYLPSVDAQSVFKRHLEYGKIFEPANKESGLSCCEAPSSDRKLRVGYISADFRNHSVAFFACDLIAGHDRDAFDVYCYYNATSTDEVTRKFQKACDHWCDIALLTDQEVLELIRGDEIDLLVDLSGHTDGNRLTVFAQRAAPVQATWLGYLNTTGLRSMDFRISDRYSSPVDVHQAFHAEKLLHLDTCQWCYAPLDSAPPVSPLSALSSGVFTFGSFHNLAKLNEEVFALWARVLSAVPGSRLILVAKGAELASERINGFFAGQSVESDRIECIEAVGFHDYLGLHSRIDMCLDTFPYGAATTTCHSLWMGVPVITLRREEPMSRSGVSILTYSDLTEFIADSDHEYVAIASYWAANPGKLADLRSGLRERLNASAVMDAQKFVAEMEALYRYMLSTVQAA